MCSCNDLAFIQDLSTGGYLNHFDVFNDDYLTSGKDLFQCSQNNGLILSACHTV